jgi:phospholipase C
MGIERRRERARTADAGATRGVHRRDFLKRAGLVGGAAAAVTALPGCRRIFQHPPFRLPTSRGILECAPSDAPIDTVVVLMMENRSFDHWLGWLADDHEYLDAGRHRYGHRFCIDGDQDQTFPGPNGPVATTHLLEQVNQANPFRGCDHPDPGHGWTAGRAERDGGFLAPGSGNDEFAVGYYEDDDLPFTSRLAKRFTTFDRFHASVLGPTYPNREYLHSAQSGGQKTNYLPIAEGGFQWPTIWDRLFSANVPARYYYSDLPTLALWGNRLGGYIHHVDDYFADCAAGALPNVVFVDPKFLDPGRSDDHPHADIRAGQAFARDAFRAFVDSPHWDRGLFVLTYDEWGGFFDHVPPPHFPDDRASAVDVDDFSQAGFRVPTVIASPFARPGYVDHRTYEHTSVLRFLEWRFLGAPPEGPGRDGDTWFLTTRDRNARNLGASLLARRVTNDPGFDLDVAIDPPSPLCPSGPEAITAARVADEDDDAFRHALESGYFDRVGMPVFP